jgi:hypothetical protein
MSASSARFQNSTFLASIGAARMGFRDKFQVVLVAVAVDMQVGLTVSCNRSRCNVSLAQDTVKGFL